MPKLIVGNQIPDFSFDTPFETARTLGETASRVAGKTALVFLRYYGCTLCQYDIHRFAEAGADLNATGGQLLVVLQSDPIHLAGQLKKGDLPFDILCDPDQVLYRQFDIVPATSKEQLGGGGTKEKRAEAIAAGYHHGDYEGDELQLPAAFVVDRALRITYAHYGTSAGDVPSPAELVQRLAEPEEH